MHTLTNSPFATHFTLEHFCFTSHLHWLMTSHGINFIYFTLLLLFIMDSNPELTLIFIGKTFWLNLGVISSKYCIVSLWTLNLLLSYLTLHFRWSCLTGHKGTSGTSGSIYNYHQMHFGYSINCIFPSECVGSEWLHEMCLLNASAVKE